MHHAIHALTPAILFLALGIAALVASRALGLSAIVGYIAAGVLVAQSPLPGLLEQETLSLLAELGVVFLLFEIGLHFSVHHLWEVRRDLLGLGPVQMLLGTLVFALAGVLVGIEPLIAVVVGAALAMSSTAVVSQMLAQKDKKACPAGASAMAVLIFQDIFAIFLLILAGSLGSGGGSSAGAVVLTMLLALLKAGLALAAALALGRWVLPPLLRLFARTRTDEVFSAVTLLVVLLTAAATASLELSLTLGAFLAGMMLASSPYRARIEAEVKPFRGLLLGFFFITIGLTLDLPAVLAAPHYVLAVLVLLLAVKLGTYALAGRLFGMNPAMATGFAFLLAQGGELAFVILSLGPVRQALDPALHGALATGVALSLAISPAFMRLGKRATTAIAGRLKRQAAAAVPLAPLAAGSTAMARLKSQPSVIFGMNAVGRRVADALAAHDIPYLAVDFDHDRFLAAMADGYPVAFADLGDPRMAGVFEMQERSILAIAVPRLEVAESIAPLIRETLPDLTRLTAVSDEREAAAYAATGVVPIISRSEPPGLELAVEMLRRHLVPEAQIRSWLKLTLADRARGEEPALLAAA